MSSSLNHFIPPSFIFFRWSQVSTEKRLTNGNMISRDSTGKGDSVPCLIFTMWSHTVQSYYEVTVAINNQSRVHSLMKRRWKWQFTCMWDTIRVVALALCRCSCFFLYIYILWNSSHDSMVKNAVAQRYQFKHGVSQEPQIISGEQNEDMLWWPTTESVAFKETCWWACAGRPAGWMGGTVYVHLPWVFSMEVKHAWPRHE